MMGWAMDISFAQSVSVPADVLCRELNGELVLLDLDGETYFGLDEVGARMRAVLTTSDSIQAAHETLLDEYDVAPDVLKRDITELVQKLVAHRLLELSNG